MTAHGTGLIHAVADARTNPGTPKPALATVATARRYRREHPDLEFVWVAPQVPGGKTRVYVTAPKES